MRAVAFKSSLAQSFWSYLPLRDAWAAMRCCWSVLPLPKLNFMAKSDRDFVVACYDGQLEAVSLMLKSNQFDGNTSTSGQSALCAAAAGVRSDARGQAVSDATPLGSRRVAPRNSKRPSCHRRREDYPAPVLFDRRAPERLRDDVVLPEPRAALRDRPRADHRLVRDIVPKHMPPDAARPLGLVAPA